MKPEETDEYWTNHEYADINQHNTDSQVSQRRNPKGSQNVSQDKEKRKHIITHMGGSYSSISPCCVTTLKKETLKLPT